VPAFYSARDTKTPVIVASISFILNIVLNVIFLQFLFRRFQNGGPALATALPPSSTFSRFFIIFRLRYGSLACWIILRSISKISLCSLIMGAGIMIANYYAKNVLQGAFPLQLTVFTG